VLLLRDYVLIKDPLHGYIRVFSHEKCIIDTPAFQRLRRLKQLSTTYLVYPGATHSRFLHSLGVMHVAGVFAEHIYSHMGVKADEVRRLVTIARLLGLLHDIGHGPFSHTFEDHVLVNYETNHEVIGGRIIREIPEVSECFDKYIEKEIGVSAEDMGKMVEAPSPEVWPLTSSVGEGVTERSLYYIIKGPYSADIIDYLIRDSFFTGANYGLGLDWERLAYNSRFMGDRIVLEYKAKDVLDHMLIARIFMFKTVYFHKTTRAFDKIAGEMLVKAKDILGFDEAINDVSKYLMLDDEYVLSHPRVRELPEAKYLLERRVPYKAVYQAVLPIDTSAKVFLMLSRKVIEDNLEERLKKLTNIESEYRAVFVDTPKLPTNPMFEETDVRILNPDGSLIEMPVRETVAGLMPKEIAFIRIYIRDSYAKYGDVLKGLADTLLRGKELRSFF